MNLRPDAVRMVLSHGLPVVLEVMADSMTPSLERGVKVKVEAPTEELRAGDVAVIETAGGRDLLLHRVMHLYGLRGRRFVIHQGDAPGSTFATCPREAVIGRAISFSLTPSRPFPTLENLPPDLRSRFARRRRAAATYSLGRRLLGAMRLGDRALTRRLSRMYRALARKVAG